jgi:hypothetical protein
VELHLPVGLHVLDATSADRTCGTALRHARSGFEGKALQAHNTTAKEENTGHPEEGKNKTTNQTIKIYTLAENALNDQKINT